MPDGVPIGSARPILADRVIENVIDVKRTQDTKIPDLVMWVYIVGLLEVQLEQGSCRHGRQDGRGKSQ